MTKEFWGIICIIIIVVTVGLIATHYSIQEKISTAKGKDCEEKLYEVCPACAVDYHAYSTGTVLQRNECECCGKNVNIRYCIKKIRSGEFAVEQTKLE